MPTRLQTSRPLEALVVLGFLVSGACGLVYEVVWARWLGLVVGSTARAHTVTLAAFLGGLALGNALIGRRADATERRLRLYGLLEVGIGAWGLLFPTLADRARTIQTGTALDLALAASLVVPPTVLMGGTLPVLARALTPDLALAGRRIARLYFLNSLGAMTGAALAGFWLLESLGMTQSVTAAAIGNLSLGALFLLWARIAGEPTFTAAEPGTPLSQPPETARLSPIARSVLGVITLSGALALLDELVWTRLLALVLGSSTYAFALMLVVFIGGIALGSLLAGKWLAGGRDAAKGLLWAEAGVAVSMVALLPVLAMLPWFFHLLSVALVRTPWTFPLHLFAQVVIVALCMAVPTILLGATLPLASAAVVDDLQRLGRRVGTTFSLNTLGNLAGAALAGLVVIPAFGVQVGLAVGIVGAAVCAAWLGWVQGGPRKHLWLALPLLCTLGTVALPGIEPQVYHSGIYRQRKLLAPDWPAARKAIDALQVIWHADGENASIAVLKERKSGQLYLKSNGKTEASTDLDMSNQVWQGLFGLLIHPDKQLAQRPVRVAMVGLASGVSAAATVAWPTARLDLVEIEPHVLQAARYFDRVNEHVIGHPRVTTHVEDARAFFQRQPEQAFDVITAEPSNPWVAGIGNLFSEEFFRIYQSRLKADGLMVQWLHVYEMDDTTLRMVLDTFGKVFEHASVWRSGPTDVLLIGARRPLAIDLPTLQARLDLPDVKRWLTDPKRGMAVRGPVDVLDLQMLSEARFAQWFPGNEPLNRDDKPLLELRAPNGFWVGKTTDVLFALDEHQLAPSQSRLELTRLYPNGVPGGDVARLNHALDDRNVGLHFTDDYKARRVAVQEAILDGRLPLGLAEGVTLATSLMPALELAVQRAGDPMGRARAEHFRLLAFAGKYGPVDRRERAQLVAARVRRGTTVYSAVDPRELEIALRDWLAVAKEPAEKVALHALAARTWYAAGLATETRAALDNLHAAVSGDPRLEATPVPDPFRRLPDATDGPAVHLLLYLDARLHLDAGHMETAAGPLAELLRRDPSHVAARAHAGWLLRHTGH
jgi:spermidine synthase